MPEKTALESWQDSVYDFFVGDTKPAQGNSLATSDLGIVGNKLKGYAEPVINAAIDDYSKTIPSTGLRAGRSIGGPAGMLIGAGLPMAYNYLRNASRTPEDQKKRSVISDYVIPGALFGGLGYLGGQWLGGRVGRYMGKDFVENGGIEKMKTNIGSANLGYIAAKILEKNAADVNAGTAAPNNPWLGWLLDHNEDVKINQTNVPRAQRNALLNMGTLGAQQFPYIMPALGAAAFVAPEVLTKKDPNETWGKKILRGGLAAGAGLGTGYLAQKLLEHYQFAGGDSVTANFQNGATDTIKVNELN